MSYGTEELAARLKAAREAKGLSQRELSALVGVPQSHISKIENNAVDLRVTSLSSLAHALDLELMLVPRKALPAVQSIARSVASTPVINVATQRELDRIQETVNALASPAPGANFENLQRRIREIARIQSQIDSEILQKIRRTIESSGSNEAVNRAAENIRSLRNQLARRRSLPRGVAPGKTGLSAGGGTRWLMSLSLMSFSMENLSELLPMSVETGRFSPSTKPISITLTGRPWAWPSRTNSVRC
jgi:transcriptional regulator with XRE-family HTH domain